MPAGAMPCVNDGRPAYQRIRPVGVVIVIVLYWALHSPVELPAPWYALVATAFRTAVAAVTVQVIAEVGFVARHTAATAWSCARNAGRAVTAAALRAGRWIADRIDIDVNIQCGSRSAVRRARLAARTC
jgi:hypothetical protein